MSNKRRTNELRNAITQRRLYFDGGCGTMLQAAGLPSGTPPETWNITAPTKITALHTAYLEAGCDIITTNTFGVNRDKTPQFEQNILAAVQCAQNAVAAYEKKDPEHKKFIAFDLGPSGRLLAPLGDLKLEDAVALFAANVEVAARAGVDLILIETFNDSMETKAAVLAAKEVCDLPIFVTNVYDSTGRLMTGATPEAMIAMLEGLDVDVLGMNCSLGPEQMLPLVERFTAHTSLPILISPNAGLPVVRDGKTMYDVDAAQFAAFMQQMAQKGACLLGGCCGTTPEYIKQTIAQTAHVPYTLPKQKQETVVSSYTHAVTIGTDPILIGERINPTGKKKLKEALRSGDLSYLMEEGLRQAESGAHILDVNVGLPEIDEKEMMHQVVFELQGVTDLPLQLDSSDPDVLADAMRIYNGKPLINSVNGKAESMNAIFPLVKRYGGTVIALTIGEDGIPNTAQGRVEIARHIVKEARNWGISTKDLIFDPLAMAVSSDANSAEITLQTVRMLHEMGYRVSLGVSNISFGLPQRDKINAAFFTAALEAGLDCAIMNPFSVPMMDAYHAYRVLHGYDIACADYIAYAQTAPTLSTASVTTLPTSPPPVTGATKTNDGTQSLHQCIVKGLKAAAGAAAEKLVQTMAPTEVIDREMIPALNEVGVAFEKKRAFLPQLLLSAEAATEAFSVVKAHLPQNGGQNKGEMILATVQGDIHDIGKNIVRVLLESYGFHVYDLGRDVPPEEVLACVQKTGCRLVGLSALMTTTVPAMETTIALLHNTDPTIRVVVGGAVLNQEYADMIHADAYAPTAMDTVHFAQTYYDETNQVR